MSGTALPAPSFVITLVHGTFARNAQWTEQDSELRKQLTEKLPGKVAIETFSWSGANSHRHRLSAAAGLNAHLKDQLNARPEAAHFVISHSHGGNVALYALKYGGLDGRLRGIVCLNTPFFCVTPRSIGALLTFLHALALAAVVLVALIVAGFLVMLARLDWLKQGAPTPMGIYAGLVAALLIACAVAVGLVALRQRLIRWLKERQSGLIENLQLPVVHGTRVFSLWTSSDEVYAAFSVLEGVSTLPYVVLHPLFVVFAFVTLWLGLLVCHFIPGLSPLGWGANSYNPFAYLLYEANDSARAVLYFIDAIRHHYKMEPIAEVQSFAGTPLLAVLVALLQAFFITLFLMVFALMLAIVFNFVLRLLPMGIGGYRFLDSLFVRLSFTLVPVSTRGNWFFDVTTDRGFLKHSIIYDDPDLLKYLVGVIKQGAEDTKATDASQAHRGEADARR